MPASSLMKPEPTAAERFLFNKGSYVDVQSCILRGLTAKGGAGVAAALPSMLAESSRPTKLRTETVRISPLTQTNRHLFARKP